MITVEYERIASLSLLRESVRPITDAYIAVTDGRAQLPPVGYLAFPEYNGDCHVKFGYILGDPVFVVKLATGFYDNPANGLPTSSGIMIAVSAETGRVIAVLDDRGLLTEIRTAVGGAIATLTLARKTARIIGIVGAGTQARQQIRALQAISDRPLEYLLWARRHERAKVLAEELRSENALVQTVEDIADLCRASDAIATTTPSAEPLFGLDWIRPGTHITALGADAPGKQELHVDLVAKADRLVTDLSSQCFDHGEFANAQRRGLITSDRCVELGLVLSCAEPGRRSDEEITIADLTGLAVQDIAMAQIVLAQLDLLKC